MQPAYQRNYKNDGLSVKAMIQSVSEYKMHWHNDMELILVLEGSLVVGVGENTYTLNEDDIILINPHEVHTTRKTKENNVLLVVQIDPQFYNSAFPNFNKVKFKCNALKQNHKQTLTIKSYLAHIVWELNKQRMGFELKIGSYLYQLGEYLLNNCPHEIIEQDLSLRDTELERITRIVRYIQENLHKKITLSEIAEMEHLNYHYLSHFIKGTLGLSFSEFLNSLRLDTAEKLLVTTDSSIISISNKSGFSNVSSFNTLFKNEHGLTPTEFRKKSKTTIVSPPIKSASYLDVDQDHAFENLFKYLNHNNIITYQNASANHKPFTETFVNTKEKGETFSKHWQNLTTFSRASEGLRAKWQRQLTALQRDIDFDYIRFHGIFMDDMMVYNHDKDGNVVYNWTSTDDLIDNFLANGLKPFFDMTFMPDLLKRSDHTIFWWKGNISPPNDIELWKDMVRAFVVHCINRYGLSEVNKWYFEVWNEPELEYAFWAGSQQEYFDFFKSTFNTIKEISEDIKVGGPSITHGSILSDNWLEEFLKFSKNNNLHLDFVSVHIFPEYIPTSEYLAAQELVLKGEPLNNVISGLKLVYHNEDHTKTVLETLNNTIADILDYKVEVHVTEWNASSVYGNLISDTCYLATYIVKNALETIGKVDSLGYWSFTDLMEEHKLGVSHFHGGFGLINKDGLKKPSYNAFTLLKKLGTEVVSQGENFIVTRDGDSIQVLAYNYTHFDELFKHGESSHLSNKDRYSIYKHKEDLKVQINLTEISGEYKLTKYQLDRNHGSVYDEWINMGAPENMTKSEISYLKAQSEIHKTVRDQVIESQFNVEMTIPAHGIKLVVLEKKY